MDQIDQARFDAWLRAADGEEATIGRLTPWGGLAPGTKVQKVALYPRIDNRQ